MKSKRDYYNRLVNRCKEFNHNAVMKRHITYSHFFVSVGLRMHIFEHAY
jgi:hypothetical protein